MAVAMLDHTDENVKDLAVYFLANVAGDATEYRDLLVKDCNIIEKITDIVKTTEYGEEFIEDLTWLISNLTKKPYLPFEDVSIDRRIEILMVRI